MKDHEGPDSGALKFLDPFVTAGGDIRASVSLNAPETLWFNTGTLCNIACKNCYIDSSPTNDSLSYITAAEVQRYLDEARDLGWPLREIGFTGGEPFMNPEILTMIDAALILGYEVLVLTNAMAPMMRKRVRDGLVDLNTRFPGRLTLRVSVDHHSPAAHDTERGEGGFASTLAGMVWLRDNGIRTTVAGRAVWEEDEHAMRSGFAALFAEYDLNIDAQDPADTVLFPEMDESAEVPEITTACWSILGKNPAQVMCATSRMVVKRRGALRPSVVACTLLPYDRQFEMGETLAQSDRPVQLNHPHCAKFCVLGGASCSA